MDSIDADTIAEFAASLLADVGAPNDIASKVAHSLVDADLCGHTSHGVLRIPAYREMIEDGALVPDASPTIEGQGNTVVVDGRGGFGQIVGRRAVDVLIERAKTHGVAGVGIRNGTHLGRMGEWAERAAAAELCFVSFVNTSGGGLVVAPAGSTDRRLSTNPITCAVPTFDRLEFPLVLDMATSQVAHGKLAAYEADGRDLPAEWAVAPDGESITQPAQLGEFREGDERGAIRPLGGTAAGYKGTGLAVMVELFAGMLGGGTVAGQRDPAEWFTNGAAFLAVDPTRFTDRETLADQVEAFAAHFRSADSHPEVPVGDGATGDGPLLPGEAEHRIRRERKSEGVSLPKRVVRDLRDLATTRGIEHPFSSDTRS